MIMSLNCLCLYAMYRHFNMEFDSINCLLEKNASYQQKFNKDLQKYYLELNQLRDSTQSNAVCCESATRKILKDIENLKEEQINKTKKDVSVKISD